jgi:excisionase family DNA binding protein
MNRRGANRQIAAANQAQEGQATGPSHDSPSLRKVLTVKDVAEYLQVHTSTIYRLLRRKRIPAFKVGTDWRFNIESIDEWRKLQEHSRR